MTDFVNCNYCFRLPQSDQPSKFFVAGCKHVFCQKCARKVSTRKCCIICSVKCQIFEINDQMPSYAKRLFKDPTKLLSKHQKELIEATKFQEANFARLLSKLPEQRKQNQKIKEWTNEIIAKRQQYEQELKAVEQQTQMEQHRSRNSRRPVEARPSHMYRTHNTISSTLDSTLSNRSASRAAPSDSDTSVVSANRYSRAMGYGNEAAARASSRSRPTNRRERTPAYGNDVDMAYDSDAASNYGMNTPANYDNNAIATGSSFRSRPANRGRRAQAYGNDAEMGYDGDMASAYGADTPGIFGTNATTTASSSRSRRGNRHRNALAYDNDVDAAYDSDAASAYGSDTPSAYGSDVAGFFTNAAGTDSSFRSRRAHRDRRGSAYGNNAFTAYDNDTASAYGGDYGYSAASTASSFRSRPTSRNSSVQQLDFGMLRL